MDDINHLAVSDIDCAMMSFSRTSSGGIYSLRFVHLKDLLSASNAEAGAVFEVFIDHPYECPHKWNYH